MLLYLLLLPEKMKWLNSENALKEHFRVSFFINTPLPAFSPVAVGKAKSEIGAESNKTNGSSFLHRPQRVQTFHFGLVFVDDVIINLIFFRRDHPNHKFTSKVKTSL